MTIRQPAPADSPRQDERIVFLGPDESGLILEVIAIETDEATVIIHAMPIRGRYRPYLQPEPRDQEGDQDA